MHDNVLRTFPTAPVNLLFLSVPHPKVDESPPRLDMRFSVSLSIGLIFFRVSDFSDDGFDFHDLIIGIRLSTSVDIEKTPTMP